jgi:hypothetical protein
MRLGLPGLAAAITLSACASQPPTGTPGVSQADLMAIAGDGWKGELVYRDYSPPYGQVKLAVEAAVDIRADGLSITLHYPREPSADGESTIELSADGRMLDGETVTGREQSGDRLTITTEARCEDDNLPATCRHIYTLSPKAFGWTKLVTLDRDGKEFQRNAYAFTR